MARVGGHSPKTIKWYRWVLTTFEQRLARMGSSTQLTTITIADARAFLKAEADRSKLYGGTSVRHTTHKRCVIAPCMAARLFPLVCGGGLSHHQPAGAAHTTQAGGSVATNRVDPIEGV